MSKIIYLDTETTGLDKEKNDIIQVAGIIGKHVNKFDKTDKFYLAGQNVKFDLEFLHSWAKKNGDIYLGSYFWWYVIDLYVFTAAAKAWGWYEFETLKLSDVCKTLKVEIENAHDALADIEATKKCIEVFRFAIPF
ncbi:MAG: hypothetical protein LBD46_05285 [Endomicrobium sp.]|jgi:DNA polymerase-3 subunit epsilon|nr:hypothetical protein [Endomicrobium sp.]